MLCTEEETIALAKYQDDYYRIINSLLRRGCLSEITIDERDDDNYPYLTKDEVDDYLSCIGLIFSAILKNYTANGCVSPDTAIYRGTQVEIVEKMDGEDCSFLSTTTSYMQTIDFTKVYKEHGLPRTTRAVAFIEGNVPWMPVEDFMAGMNENEILFVPAKVSVEPIESGVETRLGKPYKMTLSELDIPEKTPEEIQEMRTTILDQTETMSDYLKLILEARNKPELRNSKQVEFATQEYTKWKNLVVDYNHQQYRVLRNQILNSVEDKKNISSK